MSREEVDASIDSYFVCAERAALNMAHQGIVPLAPKKGGEKLAGLHCICELTGREIIGVSVSSPLAAYSALYALPMPSIKMDKGTGVVTSVPSDSADDYAMLKDLQDKQVIRDAYNVQAEWCQRDIVEIIDIPGIGTRGAPDMCIQRKVSLPGCVKYWMSVSLTFVNLPVALSLWIGTIQAAGFAWLCIQYRPARHVLSVCACLSSSGWILER